MAAGAGSGGTNILATMTLDDLASATLSKIQSGFRNVGGAVAGVQQKIMSFASQTAAMAIGVNIGNIMGNLQGLMTGSAGAAMEAQEQMRSLTRTVAGMSKTRGGGMEGYKKGADGVYESLRKISVEAAVSREELVATFSEVGANTVKTKDQLVTLIGKVAGASRALSAPVKDIVKGFAEIEKNTISANNPLIDMVKQANLMRGHNEQIAMRLQWMGRQGMLRIMNKALEEMQRRAKQMPMTLKDMGVMLRDMKTDVLKIVGEPMMRALTPTFTNLYNKITANRGAIERYARMVGIKVGEWIIIAAQKMERGFAYLKTHANEIKKAITDAFKYAKSVIEFAIRHKTALAVGLVAARGAPMAIGAGQAVASFTQGLISVTRSGIPALGIQASAAATGLKGAALSAGLFVVAIAAVTAAVWQVNEYLKETGGYLDFRKGEAAKNSGARVEAFQRLSKQYTALTPEQQKEFAYIKEKAMEEAKAAGLSAESVGARIDALKREHQTLVANTAGMVDASRRMSSIPSDMDKLVGQQKAAAMAAQEEIVKQFMEGFGQAMSGGNKAAQDAAAQIVIGNKKLQAAMLASGLDIGKGLTQLADVIGDKSKEFVDNVRMKVDEDERAATKEAPVATNVFNGGQTFNIKQDFRDQDPDRIVAIFERDISRAAESRLQARTALPFGG